MNLKFSKQLHILDFILDSLQLKYPILDSLPFDFFNNVSQQTRTCTPLTPFRDVFVLGTDKETDITNREMHNAYHISDYSNYRI
jgi:hypothetical protein